MDNQNGMLDLLPGESVLRTVSGDCWQTPDMVHTQVPGKYTFTDQRILFRGSGLIEALRVVWAIPYADIASMSTFMVMFFPTGIELRMKDGEKYRLSILKRKAFMELISTQMNHL